VKKQTHNSCKRLENPEIDLYKYSEIIIGQKSKGNLNETGYSFQQIVLVNSKCPNGTFGHPKKNKQARKHKNLNKDIISSTEVTLK
jgi:hypothetical protein